MRAIGRLTLRAIALLYLIGIWLDGVGCDAPMNYLPEPVDYFLDVAALFPDASKAASEYRVEAWICTERRWEELDTRAYFPLDPDDKENRFQRAVSMFHNDPMVTQALDEYLVGRHNGGGREDGIDSSHAIGAVRIVLVRATLPPPGGAVKRYARRPLTELGDERKTTVYQTSRADESARCGYHPPTVSAP